ncbi:hypothetical protein [Peterkaempfera bronchialis]|uniref:hypothetical protein n=1 Tax=Peterkaempfera bronchialis TaxID=2126346 RepID=UPI003C3045ED
MGDVRGARYEPGPSVPEPVDVTCLPWACVGQLVMRLREFTVIVLPTEATPPGSTP